MTSSSLLVTFLALVAGQEAPPLDGAKSSWQGFDRFDYQLDETTLAVKPADPAATGDVPGQRRCIVVAPRIAAPGRPWSWRGCYWDHQPQTEIELLRRGFHIAYITANAELAPDRKWDAWYEFLTTQHGLSRRPAFIGMSRGGMFAYRWATTHPRSVSAIYVDNPAVERESLARLGDLAGADVPILQVCGSLDPLLGGHALAVESIYQAFGGRVSMLIKDGAGHHPHSLQDPRLLADFIEQATSETPAPTPDYVTAKATRTAFYGSHSAYEPREGTQVTCRGPVFAACYDRYAFALDGVEGTINVIAPKAAAPGQPWVYHAGLVERDAAVDLTLLAAGYHIVTAPISYNADNPLWRDWDAVYRHMVGHGFAAKVVVEGAGRAAGEAWAWAIANPDRVACAYAENPVLRSLTAKTPPLDDLAALAKAGVRLVVACGSLDPAFATQAQVIEQRYRALGGAVTLFTRDGEGHYPLAPKDVKPVVAAIMRR